MKVTLKRKKIRTALSNLKHGCSIQSSCDAAGITPVSFWRWRQNSNKLESIVNAIMDSRTQIVEDALYNNAIKGNTNAQIFWLTNKNKIKWLQKPSTEVNINTNVEFAIDVNLNEKFNKHQSLISERFGIPLS